MVTRLQFSLPPALCAGKCALRKYGVSGDRRAGCLQGGTSPPQAARERVLTAVLEGAHRSTPHGWVRLMNSSRPRRAGSPGVANFFRTLAEEWGEKLLPLELTRWRRNLWKKRKRICCLLRHFDENRGEAPHKKMKKKKKKGTTAKHKRERRTATDQHRRRLGARWEEAELDCKQDTNRTHPITVDLLSHPHTQTCLVPYSSYSKGLE